MRRAYRERVTSVGVDADIRVRTAEAADYDRIVAVADDWWGRPVRRHTAAVSSGRSPAPGNTELIVFHTAMGFTVTGPVDGYDGPSAAKVLFERALT